MHHRFIVMGWLFLALATGRVWSADYYVATNGNDSADGQSITSAWQSIAGSINRMQGGDTLRVRGGTYRGFVLLTNNTGSATSPLRVIAYSNEVPILKGSRVIDGWIPYQSNVWMKTEWAHNSQQVFFNGQLLQQLGWPNQHTRDTACSCSEWKAIPHGYSCADIHPGTFDIDLGDVVGSMPERSFFWDGAAQVLFMRPGDDETPVGETVEVSMDNGIFYDRSSAGHLHVSGLIFRHASTFTATSQGWPGVLIGPHGIIEDCDIQWCDGSGLTLRVNAQARNVFIANNGVTGIEINSASNFLITGCTIVSNNYRTFTPGNASGMKIIPDSGGTVEGCEVAWNRSNGIWFDTNTRGYPIIVRNNYVHDNGVVQRPGDPAKLGSSGIFIEFSSHAEVYNNLVTSNLNAGISLSASRNTKVYNNTVIGTRSSPHPGGHRGLYSLRMDNPQGGYPVVSNQFYNNLVAFNRTDYDFIAVAPNGINVYGNEIDHNLYYRPGGAGSIFPTASAAFTAPGSSPNLFSSLSAWQTTTGWDLHALNVDPLLDAAYRPLAGSPTIDAGQLPTRLRPDRAGVPRPLDGTGDGHARMDIGAYEYDIGARILYVDADSSAPSSPYTNRATAATALADALAAAEDGDRVWVAPGVYLLDEEVHVARPLVLSGEDAILDAQGTSRVMRVSADEAVVDGFTLRNGQADQGAGILMTGASRLQNLRVLGNTATDKGGGVYLNKGLLHASTIASNQAARGGGLYVAGDASITDLSVLRNSATDDGGGVYAEGQADLEGIAVTGNSSGGQGGGVAAAGAASLAHLNVISNLSVQGGGAVWLNDQAVLHHAWLQHNETQGDGGGALITGSALLHDAVLHKNQAAGEGGGLAMTGAGGARHVTAAQNVAALGGGARLDQTAWLENSILYLNTAATSSNLVVRAAASVRTSLSAPLPPGSGNKEADPLFLNPGPGDYRLRFGSPAIDTAANESAPSVDLHQQIRPLAGTIEGWARPDMGAFEFSGVRYVDANASAALAPYNSGWTRATPSLQLAINASNPRDVVFVRPGRYTQASQFVITRDVTVQSTDGPEHTVLHVPGARGVYMSHPAAVLSGFSITGGVANAGAGIYLARGTVQDCIITGNRSTGDRGGHFDYVPGAYTNYCRRGIDAVIYEGGGGLALVGTGMVINVLVHGNEAVYGGGVLFRNGGMLQNVTVTDNTSTEGAAVYSRDGGVLRNTVLDGTYVQSGIVWSVTYSMAQTLIAGDENIVATPTYENAVSNDFRLAIGSRGIDEGSAIGAPSFDLRHVPRPLDGTADGTRRYDMGAYEFASPWVDEDDDGLSDADEVIHGTDIFNADTDGNGLSDGDEVKAGTDPLNPNSMFRTAALETEEDLPGIALHWPSATGRVYRVARSTDLLALFHPVANNITASPPMNVWRDPTPPAEQGYYRIELQSHP